MKSIRNLAAAVIALAVVSLVGSFAALGAQSTVGSGDRLRANIVRTRHILDGTVTAGKLGLASKAITVNTGSATGASAGDTTLIGGTIVGCVPTGNQDQFIDNVTINGTTGVVTVTLAANATANNTFSCLVLKPNGKGTT